MCQLKQKAKRWLMIKTRIISSLEKVVIDESIEHYPELKRFSALR